MGCVACIPVTVCMAGLRSDDVKNIKAVMVYKWYEERDDHTRCGMRYCA